MIFMHDVKSFHVQKKQGFWAEIGSREFVVFPENWQPDPK